MTIEISDNHGAIIDSSDHWPEPAVVAAAAGPTASAPYGRRESPGDCPERPDGADKPNKIGIKNMC